MSQIDAILDHSEPAGSLNKPIYAKKVFKIDKKVPKIVEKGDNLRQSMDPITVK